jgi:hypothetical protein
VRTPEFPHSINPSIILPQVNHGVIGQRRPSEAGPFPFIENRNREPSQVSGRVAKTQEATHGWSCHLVRDEAAPIQHRRLPTELHLHGFVGQLRIRKDKSGNGYYDSEFRDFDNERISVIEDSVNIKRLGGKILGDRVDSGIARVEVIVDFDESAHGRNQASEH